MIDIHSHILPKTDDGSATLAESLDLLRLAKKTGTNKIVLTPHFYNPRIGYVDKKEVISSYERLREKAKDIDIELLLGSEVFCSDRFLREIKENNFLTVNNTDYLLVEFDFHDDFDRMIFSLELIKDFGYKPIIAHPERYTFLRTDEYFVKTALSKGALFQVNTSSLAGLHGENAARFANFLLQNEFASVVASDAHDITYRNTDLQKAFMWIYGNFSKSYAEKLFFENPEKIITGKEISVRW